jgi:hypothetical protein
MRNVFARHTRAAVGAGVAVLAVVVAAVVYLGDPAQRSTSNSAQAGNEESTASDLSKAGLGSASAGASASAGPSGSTRTSAKPGTPSNGANCALKPSACGYPDATNTGWRHTGVTLKRVVADPYYVNTAGAVVDGLDIIGCVYVRAKNVTIKRSKITCSAQPMVKNFEPDGRGGLRDIGAGLVLEDVEFDGKGVHTAHGVAFNNYTVRRGYFHNLGAAAKLGSNVRIENSFVHNFASNSQAHVGGFPSDGGRGIVVRHNTVLMNSENGYTVAIYNWIPAGSVVADVVVDNNLLAGGNYILYCGAPGHVAPNLRVINNRFSRMLYPKGGNYGPSANCDDAAEWSNNYWDDTRSPLNP